MNYLLRNLFLLFLVTSPVMISSCDTFNHHPSGEGANVAEDEYKLNSGDTVYLLVYGDESLTGDYMVDKEGFITVPLIGEIEAKGIAKTDLQEKIKKGLVDGKFLNNPHVTVDLKNLQPFYILGEVKTPGSYPYQPSLDVFKAIAMAGGYTPRAVKNDVVISRDGAFGKERINASEDTPILPGDSITVRQRIF